jgi:hypothetical protein
MMAIVAGIAPFEGTKVKKKIAEKIKRLKF